MIICFVSQSFGKAMGLGRHRVFRTKDTFGMVSSDCKALKDGRDESREKAMNRALPNMEKKFMETDEDKLIGTRKGKWGVYKFMWR